MILQSPTRLILPVEALTETRLDEVRTLLTYTDKKEQFALQKFKQSPWYVRNNGQEAYEAKLLEMKANVKKCLFFEESWTYSGLRQRLEKKLGVSTDIKFTYPTPNPIPWYEPLPYKLYPYQEEAISKLLEVKHGGIEFSTGLGKTNIILSLVKQLGLKTIVMTPSTNISEQIYELFVKHLGKAKVGKFFDGKKEYKKLITIANGQSLTKVVEDSEIWNELSTCKVVCADESHCLPAVTMEKVCHGVAANAPYRFFFSATQLRGDGLGLLLEAITGPMVMKMDAKQGVDGGYLAKPIFHMYSIPSETTFESQDANVMTRRHLYYNKNVIEKVANLVNNAVSVGLPTLVLIEEVEQFTKLLPYLKHSVSFAHGPLAENREKVPKEYWESDTTALVKDFNEGKCKFLVGTSCVSTGTDIKPVKFLVYWQGGRSEVQIRQAIGRGTRLVPGKTNFHVVDFDIVDVPVVHRHSVARRKIYNEVYPKVREEI
jgi:superfamily II DNA or RNA helicase